MAVLETIRVKFGIVITVLIAVALLSFIIDPSTLQSVSSSMSSKYDVGEIDFASSSPIAGAATTVRKTRKASTSWESFVAAHPDREIKQKKK